MASLNAKLNRLHTMISNAKIHFNQSGTPVADSFDDVYFSNDNGLAESDYVFFRNNHLMQRFAEHDQRHFVIAETGFGTGLNFLNTWQQFLNHPNKNIDTLHFISFEKFPIAHDDLKVALAVWPELAPLAEKLLAVYPIAMAGCHRLEFDNGKIILDLWFGDIKETLPQLCYQQSGIVDAWYLDGFAPSKNPEMWQQSLFNAMANLGRKNATFATFTAAGFVKRGLIEAGFNVTKAKGFGRKREMLVGHLQNATNAANQTVYFERQSQHCDHVAIIGGGIASASMAYALAKRGVNTTIYCKDPQLAMGASHNEQGALYPHLQADFNSGSEFYAHSFLYAKRQYQALVDAGHEIAHQWCGVLLQSISDKKQEIHHKVASKENWPTALIHAVDANQASQIANTSLPYPGLFIPLGGWLNPPQLVDATIAEAQKLASVEVRCNTQIDAIHCANTQLTLSANGKEVEQVYSQVIIAAGEHSEQFTQTNDYPLRAIRGQVSSIRATETSRKLATVICHKGYVTPVYNDLHCVGATFEKDSKLRDIRSADNETNLAQLHTFYKDNTFADDLTQVEFAKAAIRCTTDDHHAVVGAIPDTAHFIDCFDGLRKGQTYNHKPYHSEHKGIYFLTGFGARGLCTVPLASELLCAELLNEPLPTAQRIADKLHPNRFLVKDLKRSKI